MIGLPTVLENVYRRALSVVMDFIHAEDMRSTDDFPMKIARLYISLMDDENRYSNRQAFMRKAEKIRTTFFRMNPSLTKRDFLGRLFDELDSEIPPLLDELRILKHTVESPVRGTSCQRIYVDNVDSFCKVKRVKPKSVEDLVPLK
ncbi:MAG: hypothetical protein KAW09_02995, partial [Thermoplasmata archaeon]|nr:hypothetical protein [Thermoplasmata archaeon]